MGGNAGAALSPLLLAAVIGRVGTPGTLVTIPLVAASSLILVLLSRHGAISAATGEITTTGRRRRRRRRAGDSASPEPPAAPQPAGKQRRTGRLSHGGVTDAERGPDPTAAQAGAEDRARPKPDAREGMASAGTRAAVAALALIVLFAMCRAWYQVSLTTYLPLWVAGHDGARVGIAQVLFVLAGSLPAGAVLGGALSDRVGRWQVVLAAGVLLVPANAALLTVGPGGGPALLLPLTAAIGCLIGATYPVAIIIAQEAWPRNIGLAGGLIMGLGWLPGGVGASAVGMMADNVGLARALATQAVPLAVGVLAIGAYALLLARRTAR